MSIMPREAPSDLTTVLVEPDWAIPCGYTAHDRVGSHGPAAWIVWRIVPLPCGCPRPLTAISCTDCLHYLQDKSVRCAGCDDVQPFKHIAARIEPL